MQRPGPSSILLTLVSALALAQAACGGCGDGGASAPPCEGGTDGDGDGFGDGCPAGPDCDDANPDLVTDCCAAGAYEGCACDPATDDVVACFDGPQEAASVPPCMKGTRTCGADGTWGGCVGQVLPENEACNGGDDDCDGASDEGVLSACGNCLLGCDQVSVGDEPFPFPGDNPSIVVDGVGLDPNGDLVLDQSTIEDHYLWIANDAEGTVSKLDTRTGAEVGRYAVVTLDPARLINHVGRPIPSWDAGGGGNAGGYSDHRPSRTAIDFYGDVWVANRAHDVAETEPNAQPSVTKIRNDVSSCPDLNGNGVIDTSRDVNGTPGIQISDPAEFFGEADECIALTVVVGQLGGVARALVIDAGQGIEGGATDPGNVWVGMHADMYGDGTTTGPGSQFIQLDGNTGAILQSVLTPGVRAYGAAIDGQGRLWTVDHCCGSVNLGMIDTTMNPAPFTLITSKPTTSAGGRGNYGITVDLEDRVWIGAYPYGILQRFDPATGIWAEAPIAGYETGWGVRGVAIDASGSVWAALHPTSGGPGGRVVRVDADTLAYLGSWDVGGTTPVGAGVDFDGSVWTVNQASSTATRLHVNETTRVVEAHPVTGNVIDVFPVGRLPYTYSDFTGLGLRTVTRPTGEYSVPLQGCASGNPAHWLGVTWDATTPVGTSVEIYVRAGDDLATLDTRPLQGPWTTSPADLQAAPGPVPDARYLLLTFRLISSDREATPIVHGYGVQWTCPGDPVE